MPRSCDRSIVFQSRCVRSRCFGRIVFGWWCTPSRPRYVFSPLSLCGLACRWRVVGERGVVPLAWSDARPPLSRSGAVRVCVTRAVGGLRPRRSWQSGNADPPPSPSRTMPASPQRVRVQVACGDGARRRTTGVVRRSTALVSVGGVHGCVTCDERGRGVVPLAWSDARPPLSGSVCTVRVLCLCLYPVSMPVSGICILIRCPCLYLGYLYS